MKNARLIALVLSLIVLLAVSAVAVGCGGTATTTTGASTTASTAGAATTAGPTTTGGAATTAGATTTSAAAQGNDLVVGAVNSLTGSNALTGEEEKWAQEKAVADINAKGGLKLNDGKMHKLVLKFVDDQSSPDQGATAAEQLIKSDGIKVILSSNITPVNQAVATVCEQYGAYFDIVSSWIDEPPAGQQGPSYIGGMHLKWSTDMFESALDSGKVAVGGAKAMPEADQPKKWAVMVENTPDGTGFGDATAAGLKAQPGWSVVSYEKFVEGQKDFSSIILKFQQAGVEGVVTLIAPTDAITFANQMKQQDWSPKYFFGYKGVWPADTYKALGSNADGLCYDGFWSETLPFPYSKELGAAFSADHNGATSNSAGLYYAGVQVLAQAIENAGVFEPGAIRDQVFGHTFKGTTMGDVTYGGIYPDNPGIAHIPFLSFQWASGGKRVVLYPTQYATGQTAPLVPWSQRK
jgi:branched-chain amino acid transport system substrate-binding protein